MSKINIVSQNQVVAEDLAQQIEKALKIDMTDFSTPDKSAELIFIDEQEDMVKAYTEKYTDIPVVFLSSHKEFSEEADLVIKKPFRLSELLNSLKNKKLLPKVRRKECMTFKEYSLYPVKKEIISALTGKTIKLTEKEVDILKYLYQNSAQIIEKEELLENVWGYNAEATTHTVETHIYRLRQKVEQDKGSQLILTENNGYRLNI